MDNFATDSFFTAHGGYNPTRADFIRRQSAQMQQQQLSQYALQTDPRAQMLGHLLQQNLDPTGNQFGGPGAQLMLGSLMNSQWMRAFTGGSRQEMLTGIAAGLENMSEIRTSAGEFSGPGVFTNQMAIQSMRALEDQMFTATGAARTDRTHGLDRGELGRVMAMAGQRGLLSDVGEMATVQEFRTRDEIQAALGAARERAAQTGSSADAGVVSDLETLEAALGDSNEFDIPRRVMTLSEEGKRRIGEVAEEGAKAIAAMKDMLGDLGDNQLWSAMEDFSGGRIASRRALAETTERIEMVQTLAAIAGGSPEAYMAMHGQLLGAFSQYVQTDSVSASRMADQSLQDVAMRRAGVANMRSVAQNMGLTVSDDMEDNIVATLVKDASIVDREFEDALGGLLLMQMANVDRGVQQAMMEEYQQQMASAANDPAAQQRITSEFFARAQETSGITGRDAIDALADVDDARLALNTEGQDFITQTSRNIAREREREQLSTRLGRTQFRNQGLSEEERSERLAAVSEFVSRFGVESLGQLSREDGVVTVADPSAPGGSRTVAVSEIASEMGLDFLVGDEDATAALMQTVMSQTDLHTMTRGSEREQIARSNMNREFFMQREMGTERVRAPDAGTFVQALLGEQTITDEMGVDYLRLTAPELLREAPLDGNGNPDFDRMRQMEREGDVKFFRAGDGSWQQASIEDINRAKETVGDSVQEEFLQRMGFKGGTEAWRESTAEQRAETIRSAVEGIEFTKGRNESRRFARGRAVRANQEAFDSAISDMDLIATQSPEAAALIVKEINQEVNRLEARNADISGKRGGRFQEERERNMQRIEELRDLSQKHGGSMQTEDMFSQIVTLLHQIASNTR